jgi:hypothetical protein
MSVVRIDAASLQAARQWLQSMPLDRHERNTETSEVFRTALSLVQTAERQKNLGVKGRLDVPIEEFDDKDDYEDDGWSTSDDEGEEPNIYAERQELRDNEPVLVPPQVAPGERIVWFDFGLLSRIMLGMFLLISSHSSISYRIMLGVLSMAYYLLETGILFYLLKKLFNTVCHIKRHILFTYILT